MTRQCVICGKEFDPINGKQKTCSVPCSRKNRNQVRVAYHREHGPRPVRNYIEPRSEKELSTLEYRIRYLETFYKNDQHGPRIGLQRTHPPTA